MAEVTEISWADRTFNPWIGCTRVSPGCDHCYAATLMDDRYGRVKWGAGQARSRTSAENWKQPIRWNRQAQESGKPSRVFCASLADVFDNEVDPAWRTDLFRLIEETPALTWMLLTKRIVNVPSMLAANAPYERLAPNVWLGITVVNQEEADRDIPKLLKIGDGNLVRWLSCEPLLGPINLREIELPREYDLSPTLRGRVDCLTPDSEARYYSAPAGIDWVIVGGESGQGARPMNPEWARSIRNQCADAGVAFHFKQWGEWVSVSEVAGAGAHHSFPDGRTVRRVGKMKAGHLLDGVEHRAFP